MRICISSGHGKFVRGAKAILDEVDEARKVANTVGVILNSSKHKATVYHDDVSKDVSSNLRRIVNYHNTLTRDLDVSVHFNSTAGGVLDRAIGTEVCYNTQKHLASDLAKQMAVAGGLINRGGKPRTNLYFLNQTKKPAVLLEVAFVNSRADATAYQKNFDAICMAIANTLVGEEAYPVSPPTGPDLEGPPVLQRGDKGPWVTYLQQELNSDNRAGLATDGNFGPATDSAVRIYQASRRLTVDGIVGAQTWEALETDAPPVNPPGLPPPMSDDGIAAVLRTAAASPICTFNWTERGRAPLGYIKGVALAYAATHRMLKAGHPAAVEMAKRPAGNDKDALVWYAKQFADNGMDNSKSEADILRHLFTLILGLGMRESTGKHCQGKDPGATNTTADTCEAGAWQTSFNARSFTPEFRVLFDLYNNGGGVNPQGFLETFKEGVICAAANLKNWGSGEGVRHQQISKEMPAYAAQVCALTLRNRRDHYGPINRREAQIVEAAHTMLQAVQAVMDGYVPTDAEVVA